MNRDYLIWSIEHNAWWKPREMGYTRSLSEAGTYASVRATEIVQRANIVHFHECMIPVECVTKHEGAHLTAGSCSVCGHVRTIVTMMGDGQMICADCFYQQRDQPKP